MLSEQSVADGLVLCLEKHFKHINTQSLAVFDTLEFVEKIVVYRQNMLIAANFKHKGSATSLVLGEDRQGAGQHVSQWPLTKKLLATF